MIDDVDKQKEKEFAQFMEDKKKRGL